MATNSFRLLALWAYCCCCCCHFSLILQIQAVFYFLVPVADAFTSSLPIKHPLACQGECRGKNYEDSRRYSREATLSPPQQRRRQGKRLTSQLEATQVRTPDRKIRRNPASVTKIVIKTKHDKHWVQNFEELIAFQQVHGNCNVPKSHGRLGVWVTNQRKAFRLGQMRADRKQLLDKIGFAWSGVRSTLTVDHKWMKQYDILKGYKEENGHCNVPRSEGRLATWVGTQRTLYNCDRLPEQRLRLLEEIGFIWDPVYEVWQTAYNELEQFQQLHGHVTVPRGNPLSSWAMRQRLDQAAGRLDPKKKSMLDDLGFAWSDPDLERYERQWNEMFRELESYKQLEGHVNVPVNKSPLGTWVMTQRRIYHSGQLLQHRREKLESLGFSWRLRPNMNLRTTTWDKKWMNKYEALKEYQEAHGHANFPLKEGPLGNWVDRQRQLFRKEQLREDRKALLDEIGFQWELEKASSDERWQAKYAELQSYFKEFGHFQVSSTANFSLHSWIHRQRILLQAGRLGSKRKEMLNDLGLEL